MEQLAAHPCEAPCTQIPHCDTKHLAAPVCDTGVNAWSLSWSERSKMGGIPKKIKGWSNQRPFPCLSRFSHFVCMFAQRAYFSWELAFIFCLCLFCGWVFSRFFLWVGANTLGLLTILLLTLEKSPEVVQWLLVGELAFVTDTHTWLETPHG